jgi:Fe2+ transport system protein A
MCVCDLNPGQKGFVHEIRGDMKLAKRLQALGCVEGTEILIKAVAPLGDPIVFNISGCDFAIRKKDARNIFIRGV